jgi:hypothetical protein
MGTPTVEKTGDIPNDTPEFLYDDEHIKQSLVVGSRGLLNTAEDTYYLTNKRVIKESSSISSEEMTDIRNEEIISIQESRPTGAWLYLLLGTFLILSGIGYFFIEGSILLPAVSVVAGIIFILSFIRQTLFAKTSIFKIKTSNPDVSMNIIINGTNQNTKSFISSVRNEVQNN